eukprot:8117599-Pyramimonas_sp.AAC.1
MLILVGQSSVASVVSMGAVFMRSTDGPSGPAAFPALKISHRGNGVVLGSKTKQIPGRKSCRAGGN